MSYTDQQRAVIEALGLSPEDLRGLASTIENGQRSVTVREVAEAHLVALPQHHRYTKSLQRLIHWAGDEDAAEVRSADVAEWARRARDEAREDPKARHGIGAEEAMVLAARATFAAAIRAGLLRHNPAADVALPDRPASRRTALSADQLDQAHLALLTHSRDPELDDLVFQFLRETACRRQGAIRLSQRDLAPATRAVRLIEKYGKQRWVPISAHLMQRLLVHSAARHSRCTLVLHRQDRAHFNDKWFEGFARRLQHLTWAAELGVSAHWIRHTTLTDIERIAGIRVAAAYAGHSEGSFGVTGAYTKVCPEELRLAHARLFFDTYGEADDPGLPPNLCRRALPTSGHSIDFVGPRSPAGRFTG